MSASLRALLANVIDYAGLFPPAQLPLDEAARNYARYRDGPQRWLLGRFLCPTARLAELGTYCRELSADQRWGIAAIGRAAGSLDELHTTLAEDLRCVAAFRQQHEASAVLDMIEIRLPASTQSSPTDDLALGTSERIKGLSRGQLTPCYEVSLAADWRAALPPPLLERMARDEGGHVLSRPSRPPMCFKLRCGGPDASAVPPVELVAFTIIACRDAGLPLKFTAGLHHPVRHFNADIGAKMHGFINLFVAAVLAHARRLSDQKLRTIISDEEASHFHFDDAQLCWHDVSANVDEIAQARRQVLSFGSCSFEEPCADLQKLGWLP